MKYEFTCEAEIGKYQNYVLKSVQHYDNMRIVQKKIQGGGAYDERITKNRKP